MNQDSQPETQASQAESALASAQPEWLLLAHILRPQGRKGEVLAELLTDFPARFEASPRVFLAKPAFTGTHKQAREAQVIDFFLPVGKNSGRIVLAFEAISSITAAETLAGLDVLVPQQERIQPDEDASYISDLLDCSVYDVPPNHKPTLPLDPSTLVGTVADVHFPTTPDGTRRLQEAAPLLSVLSPAGNEILIPYVKAYLVTLDIPAKRILMTLPPGLTDINN